MVEIGIVQERGRVPSLARFAGWRGGRKVGYLLDECTLEATGLLEVGLRRVGGVRGGNRDGGAGNRVGRRRSEVGIDVEDGRVRLLKRIVGRSRRSLKPREQRALEVGVEPGGKLVRLPDRWAGGAGGHLELIHRRRFTLSEPAGGAGGLATPAPETP